MLKGTRAPAHVKIHHRNPYEEDTTMNTALYRYLGVAMLLLALLVSANELGVIWGA
jgi:hypothetical protein